MLEVALGGGAVSEFHVSWTSLVFLYVGPETIMPLASFIAGIVGVLLMFWRWIVGTCRKVLRAASRVIVGRVVGRAHAPGPGIAKVPTLGSTPLAGEGKHDYE